MPTQLYSPHLPALHGKRQADILWRLLLFAAKPAIGWLFLQSLCRTESPPAVSACSCLVLRAVCLLPLFACHTHCPSQHLPRSSLFCPVLFICLLAPIPFHVRQDRRVVCFSSLLGPAVCKRRKLSRWQLQHGPAVAARAPVHF